MGKIRSMYLKVTGAVTHLYHIQRALSQGGVDQTWLFPTFHRDIADWRALVVKTAARPTHLLDIICHEPTHLEF